MHRRRGKFPSWHTPQICMRHSHCTNLCMCACVPIHSDALNSHTLATPGVAVTRIFSNYSYLASTKLNTSENLMIISVMVVLRAQLYHREMRYMISYWPREGCGGLSLVCSASRERREGPAIAMSVTDGGDGDCGGRSGVVEMFFRIAEEG